MGKKRDCLKKIILINFQFKFYRENPLPGFEDVEEKDYMCIKKR